jgi:hypothetical protein
LGKKVRTASIIKLQGEAMNILKTLFLTLALTYSTFSAASAIVTEYPLMGTSDMTIFDSTGSFKYVEKVAMTLNTISSSIVPTSITVHATVSEMVAGSVLNYRIVDVKRDSCGSVHYTAIVEGPVYFHKEVSEGTVQKVFLTDHTGRYCEDLKRYQWMATIFKGTGYRAETMDVGGNPEMLD